MKQLKEILEGLLRGNEIAEGLLRGMEDTLKDGDIVEQAVEEFERLKILATDLKNYDKYNAGSVYAIEMPIPMLCKYVGVKNEDYNIIGFSISRYGDGVHWNCSSQLIDPDKTWYTKCLNLPKSGAMQRTKEKQLEKYIAPVLKDFNTFIDWFGGQVKERKY